MIESLKHLPLAAGSNDALARQFTDLAPALTARQAAIESARCLYCYDAPCMRACPTGIDVASFIRNIHDDNINGAAFNILKQNIFGGACARVCPTEILCEDACVRNHDEEHQPVKIGLLQRHAIDNASFKQHPFERAPRVPARPSPWSVPGRPAWPVRTAWPCWATTSWCSKRTPRPAA